MNKNKRIKTREELIQMQIKRKRNKAFGQLFALATNQVTKKKLRINK